MMFIKRFFMCFVVLMSYSFSFEADSFNESQSSASSIISTDWIAAPNPVSEQTTSILQELAGAVYKRRHTLLAASIVYIALTEMPMAYAFSATSDSYPGIDCTRMKPTMVLCEYGYAESLRLRDICAYGCNAYPGTLRNLASGMLNLCCDYYGYFFDFY